ncbi:hypothetical protein GQ464_002585 [Rhodocaloribacter litoris]|uniref:hypothetical protein n=1 Tax=Rhodocaloribacter litoris TaxID=2558931 RepID=UPI001420686C|nr:hypothetical protein [Rhodocaloribacter litoris]QXD15855.1 hypothetical protein GQ464_002585 [Rhodocaloribacter litoris]
MNAAHLHLLVNHLPLFGILFGLPLLAFGWWRGRDGLVRLALIFFVVAGLGAAAAYFSGEEAEEIVEHLAGVSHEAVEAHEDAAYYAFLSAIVLGVLSLGALLAFRQDFPRWAAGVLSVLALGVFVLMARANNLGGQIRHPEIRDEQAAGARPPSYDEHDEP